MPSDLALKTMNVVHRSLLKLSGGRIGGDLSNMPALELTTVGRRSGQERSVMLTSPVQEGDNIVIVASRGGDDTHPAWYLNLQDHPEVKVSFKGGPTETYRAETVTGAERDRLWAALTADHENYAGYQKKTDREIPVVVLTPT